MRCFSQTSLHLDIFLTIDNLFCTCSRKRNISMTRKVAEPFSWYTKIKESILLETPEKRITLKTFRCGKQNRKHLLVTFLKLPVDIRASKKYYAFLLSLNTGCFYFYHYFCCSGLNIGSYMRKTQMTTSKIDIYDDNFRRETETALFPTLYSRHWKNWDSKYNL